MNKIWEGCYNPEGDCNWKQLAGFYVVCAEFHLSEIDDKNWK